MVGQSIKLFVGNLTPGVEQKKLEDLFNRHGRVVECDVIKNYAFVHMATEAEADAAVRHLDNFSLDGRPIHIEKSTSRLRKAPGMGAVCYSCGALDHKTPQCPRDPAKASRNSPIGNGSNRNQPYPIGGRQGGGFTGPRGPQGPPMGGPNFGPPPQQGGPPVGGSYGGPPGYQGGGANYGGPPQGQAAAGGYGAPQGPAYAPQPANSFAAPPPATNMPPPAAAAPQPAYADPSVQAADPDPVIPHPVDRDLEPLWKEYSESRERYYYFREKLTKEMRARQALAAQQPPAAAPQVQGAQFGAVGSGYATGTGASSYATSGYSTPAAAPSAYDYGAQQTPFASPQPQPQPAQAYAQQPTGYSSYSQGAPSSGLGSVGGGGGGYAGSQAWSTGSNAAWPSSSSTPQRLF